MKLELFNDENGVYLRSRDRVNVVISHLGEDIHTVLNRSFSISWRFNSRPNGKDRLAVHILELPVERFKLGYIGQRTVPVFLTPGGTVVKIETDSPLDELENQAAEFGLLGGPVKRIPSPPRDLEHAELTAALTEALGKPVKVRVSPEGKFQVLGELSSSEQLLTMLFIKNWRKANK